MPAVSAIASSVVASKPFFTNNFKPFSMIRSDVSRRLRSRKPCGLSDASFICSTDGHLLNYTECNNICTGCDFYSRIGDMPQAKIWSVTESFGWVHRTADHGAGGRDEGFVF